MHEKDHLDRMLDSALSSYGETESDSGLAERILARVESEQRAKQFVPRSRSRFVQWVALPAAACLLLTLILLKSPRPTATHPTGGLPQTATTNTGSKGIEVENVRPPALKTVPKTTTRTLHRTLADVADSAARPKLDVFPLPQPLSPEEQALIAIATATEASARENLIASQRQLKAPLEISAINIAPLTKTDQDAK
jgi:hypothetical protein